MTIIALLRQARQRGASDLLLVAGKPPSVYIQGRLQPLKEQTLVAVELDQMLEEFIPQARRRQLAEAGDVDFAFGSPETGRTRINVHKQRGSLAAAARLIADEVPSFDDLHLPPCLPEFARLPRGLVLVTGCTGSGKSTTLAAMIQYMNESMDRHVITLEDPIEFMFTHGRCIIEQREIGEDSPTFAHALRHVVRQKPDVILVGEMRDHETIATALSASETGHLVLGTLHTNTAAQTIERIIDLFEAGQQAQIRIQLANTLQAIVCQALLPRLEGTGMVPAVELMTMTPAIRRAIRDRETHLIPGMIETGAKQGMCPLDRALANLVNRGTVSADAAMCKAIDPEKLQRLTGGQHAPRAVEELPTDLPELETAVAAGSVKPWH